MGGSLSLGGSSRHPQPNRRAANPGDDVQNVVSFRPTPKFDGDQLAAVFVTDIRPTDRLRIEADD